MDQTYPANAILVVLRRWCLSPLLSYLSPTFRGAGFYPVFFDAVSVVVVVFRNGMGEVIDWKSGLID